MTGKHPWYDAVVAASASCCWMGAWPPAQWLNQMHPDGGVPEQARGAASAAPAPERPKQPRRWFTMVGRVS